MLGVFLNSLMVLGPLPSVSELLMTKELSFTAAGRDLNVWCQKESVVELCQDITDYNKLASTARTQIS